MRERGMGGLWVRVRENRIGESVAKMGDKREEDRWHEIMVLAQKIKQTWIRPV
jgi:hypothetical protein